MIKELPEEDVPKMGETVMKLRQLADAGLDVFDAVYRSQAAETTARSAQKHFLGEGPLGKYTNEGFDSLPPEWFAQRGLTPEDMVFTPSMREFHAIHKAAGGTKATPEGAGVGHLYEKLYKGD